MPFGATGHPQSMVEGSLHPCGCRGIEYRALNAGPRLWRTMDSTRARRPRHRRRNHHGCFGTLPVPDAMGVGMARVRRAVGLKLTYPPIPITPASALLHFLARSRAGASSHSRPKTRWLHPPRPSGLLCGRARRDRQRRAGAGAEDRRLGLPSRWNCRSRHRRTTRGGRPRQPTKRSRPTSPRLYGRHGGPAARACAATPSECFPHHDRGRAIATNLHDAVMRPVDAYIANAAEPWKLPAHRRLLPTHPRSIGPPGFEPFMRDPDTLRAAMGQNPGKSARPPHRRTGATADAAEYLVRSRPPAQ